MMISNICSHSPYSLELLGRDSLVDVHILENLIGHIPPGVELGWSNVGSPKSSPVLINISELNNTKSTISSLSSSATSIT